MRHRIHAVQALGAVVLAAALPTAAVAAAGDLDATFGSGGKVATDLSGFNDRASAIAVQPDGKIVVAGTTNVFAPASAFLVTRYNADGSLDQGFGIGGKATAVDGGNASALAVQADGKIVVAGSAHGDFALARFTTSGALDAGFGAGGQVTTDFFGRNDSAAAVAIDGNGRIVVAGIARASDLPDFALARYNSDGSLDVTFGTGGTVTTDYFGRNDGAAAVAVDGSGKIVAAGFAFSGPFPSVEFALARYNPDGSRDATFGTDGRVTTDFGAWESARALAIEPDGKIVLAGASAVFQPPPGGFDDFALARYNADGNLDATFGAGGKVTTRFPGAFAEGAGLAIQPNGKLIVVGSAAAAGVIDFALARYDAAGNLDPGFGTGGQLTTDFAGGADFGQAVALQADGAIVVAGGAFVSSSEDFAVARYLGDPTAVQLALDVRPGTDVNTVNVDSPGVIPVAIVTTDTFDATTVDPGSVCFGDAEDPAQRDCTEAHGHGHVEDVNGDARPDLLLHFEVRETGIDRGDATACLTGTTFAGVSVEGCDSVRTL
jgi:uncharacterized delta-60 repeat protein